MTSHAKNAIGIIGIISIFMALSAAGLAQRKDPKDMRHNGLLVTVTHTNITNPIFRDGFGSEEVVPHQTRGNIGGNLGYEINGEHIGGALRFSYSRASFDSFTAPLFPGSPMPDSSSWTYTNPKSAFYFADMIGSYIPDRRGIVGIYGLVGLGVRSESGTVKADEPFTQNNGERKLTEFVHSFGFGGSIATHKRLAVHGELRFVPGDKTTNLEFDRSEAQHNYYRSGSSYYANYTRLVSFGVSFRF